MASALSFKALKACLSLSMPLPHLIDDHPCGQVSVSVGALLCVWEALLHVLPWSPAQMWRRLFCLLVPLGGFRSRHNPECGILFFLHVGVIRVIVISMIFVEN